MRNYVLILIAALPIAASAQPPRRDPILFVHGWRGSGAQWNTMTARFREDGWRDNELFAWTFDARESNVATAARIAARVEQVLAATGAERVDIVTHSMGALSARYYLKNLRSAGKVDAWVSLGGPNHGIIAAGLCPYAACREMRRGSPFLAALNRADETPGTARYATWRSPCDEIIDPPETVILDGAANHQTRCISHLELLRDTAVYRAVRDFVAKRGARRIEAGTDQAPGGSLPAIGAWMAPRSWESSGELGALACSPGPRGCCTWHAVVRTATARPAGVRSRRTSVRTCSRPLRVSPRAVSS
jgi:triacylglycerol lipase